MNKAVKQKLLRKICDTDNNFTKMLLPSAEQNSDSLIGFQNQSNISNHDTSTNARTNHKNCVNPFFKKISIESFKTYMHYLDFEM